MIIIIVNSRSAYKQYDYKLPGIIFSTRKYARGQKCQQKLKHYFPQCIHTITRSKITETAEGLCLWFVLLMQQIYSREPESVQQYFIQVQVQSCLKSTGTLRTFRDGELRPATSTFTQLLSSDISAICSFVYKDGHTNESARWNRKKEPKRNRTDVHLLTSLTTYR